MLDGKNVFHVHDCFPDTRFYRKILKFLEKKVRLFVGVSGFVAASLRWLGLITKGYSRSEWYCCGV